MMDILARVLPFILLCFPVYSVKLPPDMSQGIFCESCSAVMKELNKILAKKSSDPRELQVVEAMEDICQAKYFSRYEYSPPTTVKACKFLIEKYEEDIEKMLVDNVEDTEKKICYGLTKACDGVDRTKKEKEELDFRVNNEKQEVKKEQTMKQEDDGIHRMNVDINDPGAAERLAEQIKSQLGQQTMGGGGSDNDDEDDDDEEEDDIDSHDDKGDVSEGEDSDEDLQESKANEKIEL